MSKVVPRWRALFAAWLQPVAQPEWNPSLDDIERFPLPFCGGCDCHQFDGKRCAALGMRPGRICEPAVLSLVGFCDRVDASLSAAIEADPPLEESRS